MIKIIIAGDDSSEHNTFVINDDTKKFTHYYCDGYEGTSSGQIIAMFNVLDTEYFEVHQSGWPRDRLLSESYTEVV